MDAMNLDESQGIRFTWNTLTTNRADMARVIIPLGFHYTPNKKIETMQILDYDPLLCPQCKAVISPLFAVNIKAKVWECHFCKTKVKFPLHYSEHISETNLPAELYPENTTVEYKLSKKETNWPTFLFVIDTTVEEEEFNELKSSIQEVIANIPQDCYVGVITFGAVCNVHELGNVEFPTSYTLKGDKLYKTAEIQEQLSLNVKTNAGHHLKFLNPLRECAFALNTFLDDLHPDGWGKKKGERHARCGGLALQVAVTMLESLTHGEPSRILAFFGGATTIGHGQIVGKPLTETIRNYVDFEKGNTNTKYNKQATEFYDVIANRACKAGQIVDIFSCSLNQVGLMEMKRVVEKTGGYMLLTDSFFTMVFKESLKKMFEVDEYNNLKMCFKAKMEVNTSNPVKISGALGHLSTMEINAPNVSEIKIGESGTKSWSLGGMDQNSTYSVILDTHSNGGAMPKTAMIQVITTYVAGDRTHRLRVITVEKTLIPEISKLQHYDEIGLSFDQEAAAVLIARICVLKGNNEEGREVLKWIDKILIRLMAKFSKHNKDDPKSFRLTEQFTYFPQFMFYLRRSCFVQNFNASPDEITYFKSSLLRENVVNSTIMIQPILFAYSPENPVATPVFLDIGSMKSDNVLLLDAFFFIVIWHGDEVCKWREAGYHNDPEYDNIKQMLDNPTDYAQTLLADRLPISRFISCDTGSGQERLLKSTVNPSSDTKNKIVEEGFCSDDVSLKVFMDYLKKLAVSS